MHSAELKVDAKVQAVSDFRSAPARTVGRIYHIGSTGFSIQWFTPDRFTYSGGKVLSIGLTAAEDLPKLKLIDEAEFQRYVYETTLGRKQRR
jgi:hypothetical protein